MHSSDQAYRIAIPYIREYAKENNRLILSIEVTFWNSSKDLAGQRGNTSLFYPEWEVSGGFAKDLFDTKNSFHGYPYGVFGYSVLIWADTGEIRSKGAQGIV